MPRTRHELPFITRHTGIYYFNPRATYEARTGKVSLSARVHGFQSTCHVRGTNSLSSQGIRGFIISIHVPRTRHEQAKKPGANCQIDFNPRATYEARTIDEVEVLVKNQFQSTCHVRGTNWLAGQSLAAYQDFNPRATYEARTCSNVSSYLDIVISIHVPRTRHELFICDSLSWYSDFNPRATYEARTANVTSPYTARDSRPESASYSF